MLQVLLSGMWMAAQVPGHLQVRDSPEAPAALSRRSHSQLAQPGQGQLLALGQAEACQPPALCQDPRGALELAVRPRRPHREDACETHFRRP